MKSRGLSIGDNKIMIGKLPGKKQIALYEVDDNGVPEVLAFFQSEEKAKKVQDWLELLFEIIKFQELGKKLSTVLGKTEEQRNALLLSRRVWLGRESRPGK
jgi:hypothetical protein